MIGWKRKNNRAARAARFLVQFFDVACQTMTYNFRQREPAAVNFSFSAFTGKQFVPSKRKRSPILYNVTNME